MDLAFISLRLTFGGSPNPSIWGDVSETTCDLAHAILNHPDWDPSTLFSPITSQVPPDEDLPENIPFAQALPTIVQLDINTKGTIDVYIDDIITTCPDLQGNRDRGRVAVLLAIHIMGRPLSQLESIPRDELVSIAKLLAESNLSEIKIFLGCKLDTRKLLISLPTHKYKAWKNDLIHIVEIQRSTYDELDTNVGRLTHISVVIRPILHFLSRLRFLKDKSKSRREILVPLPVIEDLKLFIELLEMAHKGISMNLITYRSPTHLHRSDACPAGLDGFSHRGRAWRFYIPPHLQFRATLNFLERIACEIGPWIDLTEGNLPQFSCILSQTDSTTAAGWLRKSNFPEDDKENEIQMRLKREVSRAHASRMMKNNVKTYSQWFPGDANDLADSLSRDFHYSDDTLTSLLEKHTPSQVPKDFKIRPLPQEIESWLYALLQQLPEMTQSQEAHAKSKLLLGKSGANSSIKLNMSQTNFSTNSVNLQSLIFSPVLPKQIEKHSSLENFTQDWLREQSEVPWTMWLRPSGIMEDQTHALTAMAKLPEFYQNSTKAIKTKILQKNSKKQSLPALSKSSVKTSQQN